MFDIGTPTDSTVTAASLGSTFFMKNSQTFTSISMAGSTNGALVGPCYSFRDSDYTIREYIRNFIMSKLETNTIDTISGTTNLLIGSTNFIYSYI